MLPAKSVLLLPNITQSTPKITTNESLTKRKGDKKIKIQKNYFHNIRVTKANFPASRKSPFSIRSNMSDCVNIHKINGYNTGLYGNTERRRQVD